MARTMKLSAHFSRHEAKCQCGKCDYDSADIILVRMLEDIRLHFNRPVIITSWNRCPEYNLKIGGAVNSWHTKGGRAADFIVKDVHPHDVYDYCDMSFPLAGVGKYEGWTHLDSRGVKARW